MYNGGKVAFVAEPNELICILGHVPYHLHEVGRILGSCLAKGQTLGAHMEPERRKTKKLKETKENMEAGSADLDIYPVR